MTAEKVRVSDAIFMIQRPSALLRVRGSDAFTFLQGQFTNDLRRKCARPATYGLWLNAKGKVQADSFVLQCGPEEMLLVSLTSDAATIRARLEAYIIADDVTLEDETMASTVVLFSAGSATLSEGAPPAGEHGERFGGLLFRGRGETIVWLGTAAGADNLVSQLREAGFRPASSPEFERRRILAGVPSIPADIGPADLPQEGGLEHDAVSFNKGCYLGQEVMARLHAMGQVRRTLISIEADGTPPAGAAPVFAAGKAVGELRSRCACTDNQFVALAIVQRTALGTGSPLSLAADGSQPLRVLHETPRHD